MTKPFEKAWITDIFKAGICKRGGVVRRKVADVERIASEAELVDAVDRRGWHLVESGDQYVMFCNEGTFRVIR